MPDVTHKTLVQLSISHKQSATIARASGLPAVAERHELKSSLAAQTAAHYKELLMKANENDPSQLTMVL